MDRSKEKFSDFRLKAAVKKLLVTGKRDLLSDGGNLYLSVIPPSAASWVFRFTLNGTSRTMGLGSYPDTTLAEARALALEGRKLLAQGRDPLQHKRAQAAAVRAADAKLVTFDQCAAAYVESHRKSWTNAKHAAQWKTTLAEYASPVLGKLAVADVDTGMVMRVLKPLWERAPETASRLRGRIEAVLGWAIVNEYRPGPNPAQWKNHLDHLLPARSKVRDVKHLDAMAYTEIAGFVADLREQYSVEARALEFLILTAGRSGEVRGARWGEIDLADKSWSIPGHRMKGGKPHRVVLSDAAIAALERIPRAEFDVKNAGGLVFSQRNRLLPDRAMRDLLRKMRGNVTVHGFRATFKTWATERTAYPRELIEVCLAHAQTDALELAYQRGEMLEKRRRLMEDWARHCAAPASGSVVPLRNATRS